MVMHTMQGAKNIGYCKDFTQSVTPALKMFDVFKLNTKIIV